MNELYFFISVDFGTILSWAFLYMTFPITWATCGQKWFENPGKTYARSLFALFLLAPFVSNIQ